MHIWLEWLWKPDKPAKETSTCVFFFSHIAFFMITIIHIHFQGYLLYCKLHKGRCGGFKIWSLICNTLSWRKQGLCLFPWNPGLWLPCNLQSVLPWNFQGEVMTSHATSNLYSGTCESWATCRESVHPKDTIVWGSSNNMKRLCVGISISHLILGVILMQLSHVGVKIPPKDRTHPILPSWGLIHGEADTANFPKLCPSSWHRIPEENQIDTISHHWIVGWFVM